MTSLGMIFNSFSDFTSSLLKSIHTVIEGVYRIEASTLVGTTTVISIPENMTLERNIEELDMDRISDRLSINGLDSRINYGADELRVGEAIIISSQDLKAYLVTTNCGGMDFRGFVCPYNILTCTQRKLKGEEN